MDQGIYTAAAGARAMEDQLAVISNNIANTSTTGFKKDAIVFEQFAKDLDTAQLSPGQYRRTPVDVIARQYYIDLSQGSYKKTGRELDLAMVGDGFFVVQTQDGDRFTRSGSFMISPEGVLVNAQGHSVQGQSGEITLGAGRVKVDPSGTVSLNGATVDVLNIVNVSGADLVRAADGLFTAREGVVPERIESPIIEQGSLEMSNVEPIKEMVGLINTQRAYEAFQKVIRSFDTTYSQSISSIGETE
ncbi:MAG: flagellar basal-body rod protein FlgF [Deltaproteobacteria bacterium]|nr:flagellar basal-body rod protein FlgF [Deltaproteobacteria bacterium]